MISNTDSTPYRILYGAYTCQGIYEQELTGFFWAIGADRERRVVPVFTYRVPFLEPKSR